MADLNNLSLLAFIKGANTPIATGDKGTGQVAITGLKPGTVVADGDYQVAFADDASTSDKVDVPGWTVLDSAPTTTTTTAAPTTTTTTSK